MTAHATRLLSWILIGTGLLAACAPAPANPTERLRDEAQTPAQVSARSAATETVEPTIAPTATSVPPTATPLPPTPTATPLPPTPTSTATPTVTPLPTPGPGDVLYEVTRTADWDAWSLFYIGEEDYTVDSDGPYLTLDIESADTYVYAVLERTWPYRDVQIDVDVETLAGPNRNNLSLVCRYNDTGWYEFSILSGGLWQIYKYTEEDGYALLASGGSLAIRMNQAENHLRAVCQGNTLALYVNDVFLGSATDLQFVNGGFGVSASTFDLGDLTVRFHDFVVRLPQPAAPVSSNG